MVITASADADTAFILGDLTAKAGANVAARYDAILKRSIGAWKDSPAAVPRALPSVGLSVSASCRLTTSFTSILRPTTR